MDTHEKMLRICWMESHESLLLTCLVPRNTKNKGEIILYILRASFVFESQTHVMKSTDNAKALSH